MAWRDFPQSPLHCMRSFTWQHLKGSPEVVCTSRWFVPSSCASRLAHEPEHEVV